MNEPRLKRVAIYARVSTDGKGQDPENQLRELRAWCEHAGHAVVAENGGASRLFPRPVRIVTPSPLGRTPRSPRVCPRCV